MSWEDDLLLWIQNNLRNDFLTPIVKLFAIIGNHGELSIIVTLLLFAFKKTRNVSIVSFCSEVSTFVVGNLIIKKVVQRLRPYDAIEGLEPVVAKLSDYSFPSGHSSFTFACMFTIFLLMPKKYGIPAFCVSVFMALSRLYAGVHYPTDVLAGSLLGIGFATFYTVIYKKKFASAQPQLENTLKENEKG